MILLSLIHAHIFTPHIPKAYVCMYVLCMMCRYTWSMLSFLLNLISCLFHNTMLQFYRCCCFGSWCQCFYNCLGGWTIDCCGCFDTDNFELVSHWPTNCIDTNTHTKYIYYTNSSYEVIEVVKHKRKPNRKGRNSISLCCARCLYIN